MRKRLFNVASLIISLALLTGCTLFRSSQAPEATLTVKSGGESVTLSWEEIQELPTYQGEGGLINSVGNVTPPARFTGIPVVDLCNLVGGVTEANSVSVIASDGYAMTFSYDQIVEGQFDTYDPSTGESVEFDGQLWPVVAYQQDGELLNEERDGAFRLTLLGSPKMVTDGHWWVKWVETIEVKQALDQWTLHLKGALSEEMDRGTFETGSAPNCHGTSWTDDEGRTWTGMPLWLLVGRVDDDNVHEEDAFNDELAEAGYEINVVAADGYSVTFDSQMVARDDDILVAYQLDEQALPEDSWPLRLVGPNLEGRQSVGAIETIEVVLP